jgi:hypothetical protein
MPIRWQGSSIDFVLQRNLYTVSDESNASEGGFAGIDASNTREDKICHAQIEEWGEGERSHGGSGIDFTLTHCEDADFVIWRTVDCWKEHGKARYGDSMGLEIAEA